MQRSRTDTGRGQPRAPQLEMRRTFSEGFPVQACGTQRAVPSTPRGTLLTPPVAGAETELGGLSGLAWWSSTEAPRGCRRDCLPCPLTGDVGNSEGALSRGWQPGSPFQTPRWPSKYPRGDPLTTGLWTSFRHFSSLSPATHPLLSHAWKLAFCFVREQRAEREHPVNSLPFGCQRPSQAAGSLGFWLRQPWSASNHRQTPPCWGSPSSSCSSSPCPSGQLLSLLYLPLPSSPAPSFTHCNQLSLLHFGKAFPEWYICSGNYVCPLPSADNPAQHLVFTRSPPPLPLFSAQPAPLVLEFALFSRVTPAATRVVQVVKALGLGSVLSSFFLPGHLTLIRLESIY